MADIFNRRVLVGIGSIVIFAYLFLVPLAPGFGPLLALCILGSIGSAIATPPVMALTVEEGRKYGMGSAIAAITMAIMWRPGFIQPWFLSHICWPISTAPLMPSIFSATQLATSCSMAWAPV